GDAEEDGLGDVLGVGRLQAPAAAPLEDPRPVALDELPPGLLVALALVAQQEADPGGGVRGVAHWDSPFSPPDLARAFPKSRRKNRGGRTPGIPHPGPPRPGKGGGGAVGPKKPRPAVQGSSGRGGLSG